MYFRTGPDIADLSLDQDGGIDFFERSDRLFSLADVFLERQSGKIEHDGIKPGLGCFDSLRERVCMIRIKKDREIEFLPQTSHQNGNLTDSDKVALALGHTNQDRHPQFLRGAEHG